MKTRPSSDHATSVTGDLARVRSLVVEIVEQRHAFLDNRAALTREQHAIRSAPLHADDRRTRAIEIAHAKRAAWLRTTGGRFAHEYFAPEKWRGPNYLTVEIDSFDALCARDPEGAAEQLLALYAAVATPNAAGLPLADRPARIAALQAEIDAAERAEEALVDSAIAAGVPLEHRPEVLTRRAEAEQRARDDAAAAARQDKVAPAYQQQRTGSGTFLRDRLQR